MTVHDFEKNIPLAQFTSFKIGGIARYFYRAKTSDDAVSAIACARAENVPYVVLSGGTNVLVSDTGFDGLVVKMENSGVSITGATASVKSGLSMAVLATKTVEAGLTGLEWGIGIPGKVGGAIRGNAGCFGRDISMNIKRVRVLYEQDDVVWMDVRQCQFAYRDSLFKRHPEWVILEAEFVLEKGESELGKQKLREYTEYRRHTQPQGVSSAGSLFMNPLISDVSSNIADEARSAGVERNGRIPAGWLIDKVGLKGKQIGGVRISEKHGNFFLNAGTGTAEEMVMLISFAKQQVRDQLGVQLHEEVHYIGF